MRREMSNLELARTFERTFAGGPATVICRAPGRVNLLGEHTDYNGLPVLPMTIDRAITVVARVNADGRFRLRNTDPHFSAGEFVNAAAIPPSRQGSWINYSKAAIEGVNGYLGVEGFAGMDLLYHGTIPPAAGLSSSSAMVVATALAYMRAVGHEVDSERRRIELAAMLAQAERYVGVHGGGMDQAIILLGATGCACKIDFFPLRVERVPVFDDYVFVICNSLVMADKSGSAIHRYNEGPLTCRLIRALVEKQARLAYDEEIEIEHLGDLWYGPLCLTHSEVEALFAEAFPTPRTTLAQAASLLDTTEAEIRRKWLGDLPEPEGGFPLQARARHQLTETARVEQGRDCLLAGDAVTFGALMNESHRSCAENYFVSSEHLDRLVNAARSAGSLGSRLTGAGFGGCTVNLVGVEDIGRFGAGVAAAYYQAFLGRPLCDPYENDWMLVARPVGPADCEDL